MRADLAKLDAKAEQGLAQGRRLLNGQSVVRREMEELRLESALPSALPKHLRRDWVAVFGKAASLELEEFILGGKSHVKSAAWDELMAGLSDRCGMAGVFSLLCVLLSVPHTLVCML